MAGSEDAVDWQEEANAAIQDVKQHVHSISISNIPCSEKKIYFNVTILELKDFCVELTQEGFQVVGEKYDSEDERGKYLIFETLYSLLDSLSPAYRNSFSEELLLKLKILEREQEKEQESEDERRPGEEKSRELMRKSLKLCMGRSNKAVPNNISKINFIHQNIKQESNFTKVDVF